MLYKILPIIAAFTGIVTSQYAEVADVTFNQGFGIGVLITTIYFLVPLK